MAWVGAGGTHKDARCGSFFLRSRVCCIRATTWGQGAWGVALADSEAPEPAHIRS